MSTIKSSIIKNNTYDGTRLSIVGSHSGAQYINYSEANGTRYMVNEIVNSATSSMMESVTFDAYLSFTSSNTDAWSFAIVPMNASESVSLLGFEVYGQKSDASKRFQMVVTNGSYRHSGSTLTGLVRYDYITEFTGATAYFTTIGTASVNLVIQGTSEDIDWDVYIKYKKGYHSLIAGVPTPPGPWYPPPIPTE